MPTIFPIVLFHSAVFLNFVLGFMVVICQAFSPVSISVIAQVPYPTAPALTIEHLGQPGRDIGIHQQNSDQKHHGEEERHGADTDIVELAAA